jgi:hypothetical protein
MCMTVSVASAAKIGQDFSRYARPCWINPVLGMFWLGPVWLGPQQQLAVYTIKSNLLACWLLSRDYFLVVVLPPLTTPSFRFLFSNHHTITLHLTTTSPRSLLILSLSLQACDNIPTQALQQFDIQNEKSSKSVFPGSNLLEID